MARGRRNKHPTLLFFLTSALLPAVSWGGEGQGSPWMLPIQPASVKEQRIRWTRVERGSVGTHEHPQLTQEWVVININYAKIGESTDWRK